MSDNKDKTLVSDAKDANKDPKAEDAKAQDGEQNKEGEEGTGPVETQEEEDADLKSLKAKLKQLQDKKPPENKDELISYLMERLEQAEGAIGAAEECMEHERE